MAFFLGLLFISLFFKSIDELRRDTFLRSFRLCRGGGISPVIDTYVVVVVVAEAIVGCCGISEAEDRLLLLPPTPAPPPDEEARDLWLRTEWPPSNVPAGSATTPESTRRGAFGQLSSLCLKLGSSGNIHVCVSARTDAIYGRVPASRRSFLS